MEMISESDTESYLMSQNIINNNNNIYSLHIDQQLQESLNILSEHCLTYILPSIITKKWFITGDFIYLSLIRKSIDIKLNIMRKKHTNLINIYSNKIVEAEHVEQLLSNLQKFYPWKYFITSDKNIITLAPISDWYPTIIIHTDNLLEIEDICENNKFVWSENKLFGKLNPNNISSYPFHFHDYLKKYLWSQGLTIQKDVNHIEYTNIDEWAVCDELWNKLHLILKQDFQGEISKDIEWIFRYDKPLQFAFENQLDLSSIFEYYMINFNNDALILIESHGTLKSFNPPPLTLELVECLIKMDKLMNHRFSDNHTSYTGKSKLFSMWRQKNIYKYATEEEIDKIYQIIIKTQQMEESEQIDMKENNSISLENIDELEISSDLANHWKNTNIPDYIYYESDKFIKYLASKNWEELYDILMHTISHSNTQTGIILSILQQYNKYIPFHFIEKLINKSPVNSSHFIVVYPKVFHDDSDNFINYCDSGKTILHKLIETKSVESVNIYVSRTNNINDKIDQEDYNGITPFQLSIRLNNAKLTKLLIRKKFGTDNLENIDNTSILNISKEIASYGLWWWDNLLKTDEIINILKQRAILSINSNELDNWLIIMSIINNAKSIPLCLGNKLHS